MNEPPTHTGLIFKYYLHKGLFRRFPWNRLLFAIYKIWNLSSDHLSRKNPDKFEKTNVYWQNTVSRFGHQVFLRGLHVSLEIFGFFTLSNSKKNKLKNHLKSFLTEFSEFLKIVKTRGFDLFWQQKAKQQVENVFLHVIAGAVKVARVLLTEVVGRFVDKNGKESACLLGKGIKFSYFWKF